MANQDGGFVSLDGSLYGLASGVMVGITFISFGGEGDFSAEPNVAANSGLVSFTGSGGVQVTGQIIQNSNVVMYGFLTSTVNTYSSVSCSDLIIRFEEQEIMSIGCSIGDSVELKRYRGDTYPVSTTLSKNGNADTTGITFKMSTQIDSGTIHTVDGVIESAAVGIVTFPITELAVSVAGSGIYDIQGNDGTYLYTYEKGVFTLLDDLTV